MNEYYVMERNEEKTIVCIPAGNDPLYGMGSWNVIAGPFATVEQAEAAS